MTEWVSVNDSLPKEGIYVLVYFGRKDLNEIPAYRIAAYRIFKNCSTFVEGPYLLHDVTHWMPLPLQPNEEIKND